MLPEERSCNQSNEAHDAIENGYPFCRSKDVRVIASTPPALKGFQVQCENFGARMIPIVFRVRLVCQSTRGIFARKI